jgi:ParB family chromosome partitioning protein
MDCPEYSLAEIAPDPNQPRKVFAEAQLEELAESIKLHGVLQPIVITRNPDASGDSEIPYLILYGECRYRASVAAGLKTIPALLEETLLDPAERLLRQLAENEARQDLSLLERAEALSNLLETKAISRQDLCEKLGKSRAWLTKMLSIASFQGIARQAVSAQTIGRMDTALRFARLPESSQKALLGNSRSKSVPITSATVSSAEDRHRRLEQAKTSETTTLRVELALPEIHHLLSLAGLPLDPTLQGAAVALKDYLLAQVTPTEPPHES